MTGASLTTLVVLASVILMLTGTAAWTRGQTRITAGGGAQGAMRTIDGELREAMSVTIDGNGKGLTYQLPQKDGDGSYVVPLQSDGVNRRLVLNDDGTLEMGPNGTTRVLLRGGVSVNPTTNAAFRVFTAGNGTVTRSLNVILMTDIAGTGTERSRGTAQETIFLRNVPALNQ